MGDHGSASPSDKRWQCLVSGGAAGQGAAGCQEFLEFLSITFPLLTSSYDLGQWTGDAPTIAFCEELPSLLLISISVCGQEKRRGAARPLNSIIPGIIETIVFGHPIPRNRIAWPQTEKP